jgi:hypothetical protein
VGAANRGGSRLDPGIAEKANAWYQPFGFLPSFVRCSPPKHELTLGTIHPDRPVSLIENNAGASKKCLRVTHAERRLSTVYLDDVITFCVRLRNGVFGTRRIRLSSRSHDEPPIPV